MTAKDRAQRLLHKLTHYTPASDPAGLPLPLEPGEQLFGQYVNDPENPDDTVYVTSLGLILHAGRWARVKFSEIEDTAIDQEKTANDRLALRTRSQKVLVPVRHMTGKLRDVRQFYRFMYNCVWDARNSYPGQPLSARRAVGQP